MPPLGFKSHRTKTLLKKWNPEKTVMENAKVLGLRPVYAYIFKRDHSLKAKSAYSARIVWKWDPKKDIEGNAKLNNTSYPRTISHARTFGLNYRRHVKAKTKRELETRTIRFLRAQGFSYTDIGRLYRCSRQMIQQRDSGC